MRNLDVFDRRGYCEKVPILPKINAYFAKIFKFPITMDLNAIENLKVS